MREFYPLNRVSLDHPLGGSQSVANRQMRSSGVTLTPFYLPVKNKIWESSVKISGMYVLFYVFF